MTREATVLCRDATYSRRRPVVGVFCAGDPRIDSESRERCVNIMKMVADRIASEVPTVEVVWSPILVDGESQADTVAQQFKDAGVWVYGLASGETSTPLYKSDLCGNLALVIGSEGEGMRQRTRESCDLLLEIPMSGGVASLNAASASAVALFEAVRQRA